MEGRGKAFDDIGGEHVDVVDDGGVWGGVTSRENSAVRFPRLSDGFSIEKVKASEVEEDIEAEDGEDDGDDLRWSNEGRGDIWKTASPDWIGGEGSGDGIVVVAVDPAISWLFLW
jgi:hypothetical protein